VARKCLRRRHGSLMGSFFEALTMNGVSDDPCTVGLSRNQGSFTCMSLFSKCSHELGIIIITDFRSSNEN
jgi:hypothetical protein